MISEPNTKSTKLFFITKEKFFEDFEKQKILNIADYKYVYQFALVLPFHLPMPVCLYLTQILESNEAISFLMSQVETSEIFSIGEVPSNEEQIIKVKKTRVEMFYINDKPIKDLKVSLNEYFDKLLTELNKLITAYLITTNDLTVYNINLYSSHPACLYKILDINSREDIYSGVFLLHSQIHFEKDILTPEQTQKILKIVWIMNEANNPFATIEENLFQARRNDYIGQYKEAILYIQIYVETFLKTLFIYLLIDEGISIDNAENELQEIPFLKMIKNHFHSRIGGVWDIEKDGSLINNWYDNTYRIRNRIAHRGYVPDYKESSLAIDSACDFIRDIIQLIKNKNKKYPKTSSYFE